MDTQLIARGAEAVPTGARDPDEVSSARIQPCDRFFLLVEQLARDSAWSWLQELATTLREIDQTGSRDELRGDAPIRGAHRHPDSYRALGKSPEQIRRVAEHYRALVSVNMALSRTLTFVRARLAHVDETLPTPRTSVRKGLSRWQEQRAKQYLLGNLASRVSNADVAAACGLSQNYFVTAFRQGTGETPHACLLRFRVAKAKELLLGPMAIADIALACGFGDQSHLTRVFAKHTGIAPGEWRRERQYERLQQPGHPSRRTRPKVPWSVVVQKQTEE